MFYAVLLAVFLLSASGDDQVEKCRKIFTRENFHCCSMRQIRPVNIEGGAGPEDFKECRDIQMSPGSCARDECLAKKRGFYVDGKIDFDAFTKMLEKDLVAVPDTLSLVKENCIKAGTDLSKYGKPDMCDLMKLRDCVFIQNLKTCPEWSDRDNCKETKALLEECSSVI